MRDLVLEIPEPRKESNVLRLSIVLTMIAVLFIVFARNWVSDNYMERLSQQQTCINMGGDWIVWTHECEQPTVPTEHFSESCIDSGGVFYECESACRNVINGEIRSYGCDTSCVVLCRY